MNKPVYRVHPIMIPFFLFFYLSGEIAIYSIVFGSLLIHEVGHLIGAKVVGQEFVLALFSHMVEK